ncbi:hypothetical protein [Olivibacter domesticus]|uniref:Uncharacterized protein n=1 Tax=Olivibacter domesticus TaxID=407022 RepID=A0A1H7MNF0_OLID1|nr:hypothetical protein [Olivibacter domesticus]SEL12826.1 hypothetical protein SAMN05661044_02074 [Olivibacter domesticus]
MNSLTAVSLKGNNEVFIKKSYTKELLAVAKGMKKDGFSYDEIAKATKLPLSLVNSLFR